MPDTDLRNRILAAAVRLFCNEGFHGASMRDIAAEAQCSLPMAYYYFKNKHELYEEVAVNQFYRLSERLNAALDLNQSPVDLYMQVIRQRRSLNEYDGAVMKIALRLWYGFEGTVELRGKIMAWERDRVANTRRVVDRYVKDEAERQVFAEVFTGFLENVITKIVMLDADIPEETLARQLNYLMKRAE